jgi:hypothetical protein
MFTLRCQSDIVPTVLSPISYHRFRCYRRLINDGVVVTGDKLIMESMKIWDKLGLITRDNTKL